MLFKFGMKNCKSISTPLERNVKLHHESGTVCDMKRFREVVGSLYLSITWPDLSYPVDLIGKFMSKPMSDHLQCVQRILRYINDSNDHGLLYRTSVVEQLVDYTNAD